MKAIAALLMPLALSITALASADKAGQIIFESYGLSNLQFFPLEAIKLPLDVCQERANNLYKVRTQVIEKDPANGQPQRTAKVDFFALLPGEAQKIFMACKAVKPVNVNNVQAEAQPSQQYTATIYQEALQPAARQYTAQFKINGQTLELKLGLRGNYLGWYFVGWADQSINLKNSDMAQLKDRKAMNFVTHEFVYGSNLTDVDHRLNEDAKKELKSRLPHNLFGFVPGRRVSPVFKDLKLYYTEPLTFEFIQGHFDGDLSDYFKGLTIDRGPAVDLELRTIVGVQNPDGKVIALMAEVSYWPFQVIDDYDGCGITVFKEVKGSDFEVVNDICY